MLKPSPTRRAIWATAVAATLAGGLALGSGGCGGRSRPIDDADASTDADAPVELDADQDGDAEEDSEAVPDCDFEPAPIDTGELTAERFLHALLDAYCLQAGVCEAKADGWSVLAQALLCHRHAPLRIEHIMVRLEWIDEGSILFQPTAARACLDALETAQWTCVGEGSLSDVLTGAPCTDALLPHLDDDEPCESDEQCASGRCLGLSECTTGRCGPHRELDDSCEAQGDCVEGSFCNESGVCELQRGDGGLCVPDGWACASGACVDDECVGPWSAGDECRFFNGPCAGGLLCLDGVCREGRAVGEECTSTLECADSRCVRGRCDAPRGPYDSCEASDQCPWAHQCYGGACVPLPVSDESCDPEAFPCYIGVCQECRCELLAGGEACDAEAVAMQCEDGYCDEETGRCVAFLDEGDDCSDGSMCRLGLVCDDSEDPPVCRSACA